MRHKKKLINQKNRESIIKLPSLSHFHSASSRLADRAGRNLIPFLALKLGPIGTPPPPVTMTLILHIFFFLRYRVCTSLLDTARGNWRGKGTSRSKIPKIETEKLLLHTNLFLLLLLPGFPFPVLLWILSLWNLCCCTSFLEPAALHGWTGWSIRASPKFLPK